MAEDKRAIQKDRDRLERIVKTGAASLASEGSSQVGRLRFCKLSSQIQSGVQALADVQAMECRGIQIWVQDTQGRPQQKCVSIKEVLEAHPYVNAEPHDQVRRYWVRSAL